MLQTLIMSNIQKIKSPKDVSCSSLHLWGFLDSCNNWLFFNFVLCEEYIIFSFFFFILQKSYIFEKYFIIY